MVSIPPELAAILLIDLDRSVASFTHPGQMPAFGRCLVDCPRFRKCQGFGSARIREGAL